MHRTDQITPSDAAARFVGVALLTAVAYLHLLDISHKVSEGVWYMVFGFSVLIAGALALAVGLVKAAPEQVRLFWVGAALLAAGALGGYFVSRAVALPQMADHHGDWINLYGVLAALAELGLIAGAGLAMRSLTREGVRHRPPPALRIPIAASVNVLLLAALIAPGRAIAHGGGHDDSTPAQGGAEAGMAAGATGDQDMGTMAAAGHGDPLLGGMELGVALLAGFGFVWWAGRTLASRAGLRPITDG